MELYIKTIKKRIVFYKKIKKNINRKHNNIDLIYFFLYNKASLEVERWIYLNVIFAHETVELIE